MLSKNIHIHIFNVSNDVATALETVEWAILERLELEIFFAPKHGGGSEGGGVRGQIRRFSTGTFSGDLKKPKCCLITWGKEMLGADLLTEESRFITTV